MPVGGVQVAVALPSGTPPDGDEDSLRPELFTCKMGVTAIVSQDGAPTKRAQAHVCSPARP